MSRRTQAKDAGGAGVADSSYAWQAPLASPPVDTIAANASTRVLLCGSQPLYRSALRILIESRGEFRVLHEAPTALEDVQKISLDDVDIVLVDFDLTVQTSAEIHALERLLQHLNQRPILILSAGLEPEACQAALRHGIAGIVLKEHSGETLLDALASAKRGQVWLDRPVLTQMLADSSHIRKATCAEQSKIALLTPRERQIVEVACTGLTNKQIGERLFISEATVRHHLGSVFAKLGVSTRSELVAYGYRHNLTPKS